MRRLLAGILILVASFVSGGNTGYAATNGPPEEPPAVTLPDLTEENSELPTASDIGAALLQAGKDEVAREDRLGEPAQVQAREDSQLVYASWDSPEAASELLRSTFAEALAILNQDPARFLSVADLDQRLGATTARVTVGGETSLLEAGAPVMAKNEDGALRKVDLALEETGDGIAPANPLVDVELPSQSAEGIALPLATGEISIRPVVAKSSPAIFFGDQNVLYANIQTDRDLLVSPIARGVELFDQLRSVNSPEVLRYEVQMPDAFDLETDGAGGANVVNDQGTVAHIPFPTAVDAQGTQVPVELEVEGEDLVLHVQHRSFSVAYPILVDPTYELTESWWWYGGSGLNALSDGTWQWGSNVTWIYGSTSCIYACWGSGRGLFVSTPNGAFNGDQYGQWTYTPPGSSSYVIGADLNPFWRDNHNCSKNQYPEAHDYAGLWNPNNTWPAFQRDRANDYGNARLSASGRVLVVGLGTGSGGSNPCWRDIMLAGASVWITDPDNPTWNSAPTISSVWTDTANLPIGVSASDQGLGVKLFKLFTTDVNGNPATQIGGAVNSCNGLKANPCPASWSTQINNYSVGGLPTGINSLALRAEDPLADNHYAGQAVLLKVDHAAPVVNTYGELLTAHPIKFHLGVDAVDGSSSSLVTAQSGMRKLEIFVDGQLKEVKRNVNGGACVNPQQGIDVGSCEFHGLSIDLPRTWFGSHALKFVAEDSLGHSSTKVLNLNLPKDETAPELASSGPLSSAAGSWLAAKSTSVTVEAKDLETGIAETAVFVDGEEIKAATQECVYGGCALTSPFPISLIGYGEGSHNVQVVAWDAAGNWAQKSWTVKVEAKKPKLSFTTTPTVPAAWTPQIGTSLSITYSAADNNGTTNGSGISKVQAVLPIEGSGATTYAEPLYSSSCKGTAESPCSQEVTGTKKLEFFPYSAQGTIEIPVKAYDLAGNVATQTITARIDRGAPQVKAAGPLAEAAAGALLGSTKLDLTVTDKGSGVGTLEVLLDGKVEESLSLQEIEADGGKQTCGGETCTLTYSFVPDIGQGLASGPHTVLVRAKDLAARTGSFSKSVALDVEEPSISLLGPLVESAGKQLDGDEAGLRIIATDPGGMFVSGIKWIVVAVDGIQVATLENCNAAPCSSLARLPYLYSEADWGVGPHVIDVQVTDWAGNLAAQHFVANASPSAVAPLCPQEPQQSAQAAGVITPSEAVKLLAAAVPSAVAPSEPSPAEPAGESPFNPSIAEEGPHSIDQ
jgi:hypothetical protein